jgi:hypothetical protein
MLAEMLVAVVGNMHSQGLAATVVRPLPKVYNERLHAHNCFTPTFSTEVLVEASHIFDEHVWPALLEVRRGLKERFMSCATLTTDVGQFFAVQPGVWQSDITWVSVDDDAVYRQFADMFRRSGVEQQLAPVVDFTRELQVYSCYYVVRSHAYLRPQPAHRLRAEGGMQCIHANDAAEGLHCDRLPAAVP